jgi:hypothetical protein
MLKECHKNVAPAKRNLGKSRRVRTGQFGHGKDFAEWDFDGPVDGIDRRSGGTGDQRRSPVSP